jgi:hypothetical protein
VNTAERYGSCLPCSQDPWTADATTPQLPADAWEVNLSVAG